jgi:hypothetical protein
MTAYLDASVLLPTLIEEPASLAVDAFLFASTEDLQVSDLAAAEVASALSRLARMNQLDTADAAARLSDFDIWRASTTSTPEMSGADARLAGVFVRRFELMLRTPDALDAAICRRLDLTLVTLDHRLAQAARSLGLRVEIPKP